MESVALRTAQSQVELYADRAAELLTDRPEEVHGRDPEDLLRLGLGSLEWIARAEDRWRTAVERGEAPFDDVAIDAVFSLYEIWLGPAELIETWIAWQAQRGAVPEGAVAFQQSCERARDRVERLSWLRAARKSRLNHPVEQDG